MAIRNSTRAARRNTPQKPANVPSVQDAMGDLDEGIHLITAANLAFHAILEHEGRVKIDSTATASAITVVGIGARMLCAAYTALDTALASGEVS